MSLIAVLFVIGVFLIAAEVFLPGGIVGIIGGGFLVGGIVVAYGEFGPTGAFLSAAASMVLVVLAFVFEIKVLPKTPLGKRLFLNRTISGTSQGELADEDAIGKTCTTLTALAPSGTVLLDGEKVEAASKSGFIEKNEMVKVIGKDNFRLIVSKT